MKTKVFRNTYKQFRWINILKILGVTCGGAATIRHLDSTTYPTKIYSLLLPFSGFGIQSAATNSECSPGFYSWTD